MSGQTIAALRIDSEFRALIPPLTGEERRQLELNILADGCRDPLSVWDGILIDGHNRHEICKANGIAYDVRSVTLADRNAAKTWIIRNQFGRRNLSSFTRAELALRLEPLVAAKVAEKKKDDGKHAALVQHGRVPQISAEPSTPIETRKEVAKSANVSHDTIAKVKVIQERGTEEVKQKLRENHPGTSINREYKAIVQAERKAEQVEAVKTAKLPEGKFHVIVSDPPWAYESRAADTTHRAANPYPSMTGDEIKAMPVGERAHDNCILWLWTTNAFMVLAHEVAEAWGFKVKTILTWGKDRMGTGDWLRGQTEHCLMCVRGKPVVTLTNQTTLLNGPMREHSRKPDEFYALVEKLCPGIKCELFSRENRDGWAAFGAEVGKF